MRFSPQPVFSVESKSELIHLLPAYTYKTTTQFQISRLWYAYYSLLFYLVRCIIKVRLRIKGSGYRRYENLKEMHNDEVERIYAREAATYEKKHHLTTHYRDTWWRRHSGIDVLSYVKERDIQEPIRLLDIATGIGLSLEEMFKIFKLFDVRVKATGIDYNV